MNRLAGFSLTIFKTFKNLSPVDSEVPPNFDTKTGIEHTPSDAFYAIAAPMTLFIILIHYMRHKIQGYTGDCCGATFLLTELSFLLASVALINTL